MMPKGEPKAQTIASMKYQKKIGLTVKGFKIKKSLAEEFEQTCKRLNVGQAATISTLMQQFIDEHKED